MPGAGGDYELSGLEKAWCEGGICVPLPDYNQLNLRVQALNQAEGGFPSRCSESREKWFFGHFSFSACPRGPPS